MKKLCLAVLLAGSTASAACGDACKQGYVDTFGMCTSDGFAWQEADAVVTAMVRLEADLPPNSTSNCPSGGTVTMSTTTNSCPVAGCPSTTSLSFDHCQLTYNDIAGLSLTFVSGSIDDLDSSVMTPEPVFVHQVSGSASLSGTIHLKATDRAVPHPPCSMSFTHTEKLNQTPAITGTMCGESIVMPLYEVSTGSAS